MDSSSWNSRYHFYCHMDFCFWWPQDNFELASASIKTRRFGGYCRYIGGNNRKKVLAEQERDELLKTVKALQQQTGPSSEEALAALKAGQTDKAEALFISIAEGLQKTGSKAYTEAAEAWR
ncbi:MAG: hypothetical protein GY927_13700, partial [bacterium]|nr:hypothetical protein [bacterium]